MEMRASDWVPVDTNPVLAGITADRRLAVERAGVAVRSRGSRGKVARPGCSANAVPSLFPVCPRVLPFSCLSKRKYAANISLEFARILPECLKN